MFLITRFAEKSFTISIHPYHITFEHFWNTSFYYLHNIYNLDMFSPYTPHLSVLSQINVLTFQAEMSMIIGYQ